MCLKPRKLATTSDGGDFDKISLEVLYLILDKLSLKDVSYKKKEESKHLYHDFVFYILTIISLDRTVGFDVGSSSCQNS